MVDELWLVTAPQELTMERLKQRNLPESAALARLANQTPPERLMPYAKVVIKNDGSLADLKTRIKELWEERIAQE
jgi:dephospho-CoA kinase